MLKLQSYDVILGCDWIYTHSPINLNLRTRELTIRRDGQQEMTICDFTTTQYEKYINVVQLNKLCHKEVMGFLIQPGEEKNVSADHSLPPEVQLLLEKYNSVFSEPTELPPSRNYDHSIPLKPDSIPPNVRPYRVPYQQKNELENQIQQLLESAIIRPSKSPYASLAILVRKKDKNRRMCIDYRKLNAQMVKNKFPIPVIEDLLDELHGAQYFSKLDLRSGYHQVRMKQEDVFKTAFRTYFGHFEYLVMSFGLTNAPATFQSLMNTIFKDYLRKYVLVFFDDILVYSKNLSEHIRHLESVLKLLQEEQLFAKLSKCAFAVSQVHYLGHIINEEGVSTDSSKIEAIRDWPRPENVTQLRSFLGLTGYYRRFVKGYGLICKPLHDMLKQGAVTSHYWTCVSNVRK